MNRRDCTEGLKPALKCFPKPTKKPEEHAMGQTPINRKNSDALWGSNLWLPEYSHVHKMLYKSLSQTKCKWKLSYASFLV